MPYVLIVRSDTGIHAHCPYCTAACAVCGAVDPIPNVSPVCFWPRRFDMGVPGNFYSSLRFVTQLPDKLASDQPALIDAVNALLMNDPCSASHVARYGAFNPTDRSGLLPGELSWGPSVVTWRPMNFLTDALFWLVPAASVAGLVVVRRAKQDPRDTGEACRKCGYSLLGLAENTSVCPECGLLPLGESL